MNTVHITKEQADLVLLLIDLVDGSETYIDQLHEKLGITGKEGFPPSEWKSIDKHDKESRTYWHKRRHDLYSLISAQLGCNDEKPKLTVIK